MPQRPSSVERLEHLAKLVRLFILRSTTAAGSGHPTSAISATDLLVGLLFGGVFRADLRNPRQPNNDRLIFSKGHAASLLYSLYAAAGRVSVRELLTYRKFGSRFEGHPMPTFPYTEAPTGSLGQGLSVGVGMSLAARLDRLPYRTWVLLGDSETTEGSVWEAIQFAGFRRLGNLTGLLDLNRLGQSTETMLGHDTGVYVRRLQAFGWKTIVVEGHKFRQILPALKRAARERTRPLMLIAKTYKGRGVSFLENQEGWHGKALTKEQLSRAEREIGPVNEGLRGEVVALRVVKPKKLPRVRAKQLLYPEGKPVATRAAFGRGLVRLAEQFPEVVVLDGEVKNSTYTELFEKAYPKRFIECYIAEQNMVGISVGLAARGKLPVAGTFAAFLTRAFDQLRMAAYAGTHQVYIGTHAGVSIGQDGPSQMGLQDLAMFRTLAGSTVLYPADAYAAERLLELALKTQGIVYLRATRNPTPILYGPKTRFRIGGSQTLRQSRRDRATIVSAGITVFEALAAADELARRRISVRVIDAYSVKPIDAVTLRRAARETKRLLVVEDHVEAGGLGEAVRSALGGLAGTVTSLAVRKVPRSGKPEELLDHQGISRRAIIQALRKP